MEMFAGWLFLTGGLGALFTTRNVPGFLWSKMSSRNPSLMQEATIYNVKRFLGWGEHE